MKKKVAVIGYGYVGKAVFSFFSDHYDTVIYDPMARDLHVNTYGMDFLPFVDEAEVNKCDLAVICVPTPMSEDGKCDTSVVQSVLNWLRTPLTLIKSTVPPKTTEQFCEAYPHLKIAFSPEYIGEGNYRVPVGKGYPDPLNMTNHEFVILGGDKEVTKAILPFFKKILGADTRYFLTNSKTAELCKYMVNSFLATKVTFCNEFYDIATAFGVDYDELREMWLADGRIGNSHTLVYEDNRGFGGKCLPKDVNAIVKRASFVGANPELLHSVLQVNKRIRKENGTE